MEPFMCSHNQFIHMQLVFEVTRTDSMTSLDLSPTADDSLDGKTALVTGTALWFSTCDGTA